MEGVTIISHKDLSSLVEEMKKKLSSHTILFQKNEKDRWSIGISIDCIDSFIKLFSAWLHFTIWENELKMIVLSEFNLTPEEYQEITVLATDYMKEHKNDFIKTIENAFECMIKNFKIINLEGFSSFCLREYRKQIENSVDFCVENILTEEEYQEFISLLRYYIETEGERFGPLNIVVNPDGVYRYFNSSLENITDQCRKRCIVELSEKYYNNDDELLSILILLLPEKVTVHGVENIQNINLLNTITQIFKERIELCAGTDIFLKL